MNERLAPLVHKDDVVINVQAALLPLPLNNGRLSQLASVKKDMDRHGEGESLRADIHAPALNKILRHFVHKGRQPSGWHNPHSPLRNAERRPECGSHAFNGLNGFKSSLSVKGLTPANDNWSPLEAA